ncbi:MAG: transposase [Nitrosomonas sp.]|nr:transposase [Nitrosomonas sp.]MDP1549428.1 transposase [Nitrosomonas sp.]
MCGVDLTRIDGIDATTALAVVSETGADMSRFATAKHFASWLAGAMPRHQDYRWRRYERQDQARSQPGGPSLEIGRSSIAQQSVSAGRVFPQVVRAHGQT